MSGLELRIPAFAQRVQSSFAWQQVMKLLGARLARLALGECDIELPFKAELTQQHGYFHGGIIGTIADSAGGYSDGPGQWRTAYRARTCVKSGRTLVVSRVNVVVVKGGRETLCATLLKTQMTMHGRPDT